MDFVIHHIPPFTSFKIIIEQFLPGCDHHVREFVCRKAPDMVNPELFGYMGKALEALNSGEKK